MLMYLQEFDSMRIFTMEVTVNEINYNKVKYLLQLLFVTS